MGGTVGCLIFGDRLRRLVLGDWVAEDRGRGAVAHAASKLGEIVKNGGEVFVVARRVGQNVDVVVGDACDADIDFGLRASGAFDLIAKVSYQKTKGCSKICVILAHAAKGFYGWSIARLKP